MIMPMNKRPTVLSVLLDITTPEKDFFALSSPVVSGKDILDAIKHKYGSFYFAHVQDKYDLQVKWSEFKTIYGETIARVSTALSKEYNPIENYNKDSTITTKNPTVTAHTYTADDTTSMIENNKIVTDSHNIEMTDNTHGNIGVTTNQQMINAETEMRVRYQIINVIVELFGNFEII